MFQKLPVKKEYLLIAATVIGLLVCYELAFKKTIAAWQLNSSLKSRLARSADLTYQPQYQERKNKNLDKIISLYKADTVNFRSNIIGIISTLAEKEDVKLSEVPTQDPLYHNDQFIIQKLNFEGDYFALLKVLKAIQSAGDIGIVRSVTIKTVMAASGSGQVKKLMMEVYLEINV